MVKAILKEQIVKIPEGLKVSIKSKEITVEGKNGKIVRSFKSFPVQINEIKEGGKLTGLNIRVWFSKSKIASCINTISSLIENMITGVSKGYIYTMKYGFKLQPSQPIAVDNGKAININHFLGRKYTCHIKAQPGVLISTANSEAKKVVELTGIDPNAIGITCAQIKQKNKPRNKDIRVFRDGYYIMSRNVRA